MADLIKVGTAQRDITPPIGTAMGAFPENRSPMQPRLAEGVLDPLYVKALALSDGITTLVICSADLISFQWIDVDPMRSAFAAQSNIPPENLILCGTHNHSGPECIYYFGGSPKDDAITHMRKQIVEAAVESISNLKPATLSTGSVNTDLAYNRREILPDGTFKSFNRNPDKLPNGPIDPAVTILRFDTPDGHPIATAIHFTAHPVIMMTSNRLFTAEYPGATCHHFEAGTSVPFSLFLQGACGNILPVSEPRDDYDTVEGMGNALAKEAIDAWTQATPETNLSLKIERWQATLPNRYTNEKTIQIEIPAISLSDDLALVFWQGEPFVELSLSVQWASPFARTVVMGYAQGSVGYVPNRRAYNFGGYGVVPYPNDPPEYNRACVTPGTGEHWIDETMILLKKLKGQ